MEELQKIVDAEGIHLKFDNLRPIGPILGLYIRDSAVGSIIALDDSLLSRPCELRCIAYHELGHHFNPPRSGIATFRKARLYSDSNNAIIIYQDDRKAMRWATDKLMPTPDVWKAIKAGYDTVSFLADHFNVTEWFVRAKIGFIRVEGREIGIKYRWRDIIRKTPMVAKSAEAYSYI